MTEATHMNSPVAVGIWFGRDMILLVDGTCGCCCSSNNNKKPAAIYIIRSCTLHQIHENIFSIRQPKQQQQQLLLVFILGAFFCIVVVDFFCASFRKFGCIQIHSSSFFRTPRQTHNHTHSHQKHTWCHAINYIGTDILNSFTYVNYLSGSMWTKNRCTRVIWRVQSCLLHENANYSLWWDESVWYTSIISQCLHIALITCRARWTCDFWIAHSLNYTQPRWQWKHHRMIHELLHSLLDNMLWLWILLIIRYAVDRVISRMLLTVHPFCHSRWSFSQSSWLQWNS